ncbi:hypothetical protein F0Z19_1056 [Vibrio cyclitrophicus]|nr:hypothetical protein F0Z19_1056 [Vibrio cyclitrophicus]
MSLCNEQNYLYLFLNENSWKYQMQNNKALQLKNELDKNIYQAEAAIKALCIEDHFEGMDKDTLAGMLWVLSNNLEMMKRSVRTISVSKCPLY